PEGIERRERHHQARKHEIEDRCGKVADNAEHSGDSGQRPVLRDRPHYGLPSASGCPVLTETFFSVRIDRYASSTIFTAYPQSAELMSVSRSFTIAPTKSATSATTDS